MTRFAQRSFVSAAFPIAVAIPFLTSCIPLAPMGASCAASAMTETAKAEMGVLSPDLGSDEIAQSFQLAANTEIESVALKLVAVAPKTESLGGTLSFKLEGDSGNAPDGNPIATATLSVSSVSRTSSDFYGFAFPKIQLKANTTYWLRLGASYNPSNTHLVYWMANDTNEYSLGHALYKDRSKGVWADSRINSAKDLLFKLGCPN